MFHPNELNSVYGKECRMRQQFWNDLGIPRKQRGKFAAKFGMTAIQFVTEHFYSSPEEMYKLIDEYNDYKKEKEMNTNPVATFFDITFDTFEERKCVNYPKNKEEETMNTETRDQRYHLERRLERVNRNHDDVLQKAFNINYSQPATTKEAITLLTSGKFKLDEKFMEHFDEMYGEDMTFDTYTVMQAIDWDMPKADKAGYKAAKALLGKAYTEANDAIKILDVEKGLEALKAFESATFH